MIDDDDVMDVALLTSGLPGWFGFVIFVVVVSLTAYAACENTQECESKQCASGQEKLLDGECVCVGAILEDED